MVLVGLEHFHLFSALSFILLAYEKVIKSLLMHLLYIVCIYWCGPILVTGYFNNKRL